MGEDVDVVLSLAGSAWTNLGGVLEPIPICPIVIQSGTHEDSNTRLKKRFVNYFACLEQYRIMDQGYCWPVPYFVVEGSYWTAGFVIKGDRGIEFFERALQTVAWQEGIKRVLNCLGHIIGLTAEHSRKRWYEYSKQGSKVEAIQEG
jgi:hypothetical protein